MRAGMQHRSNAGRTVGVSTNARVNGIRLRQGYGGFAEAPKVARRRSGSEGTVSTLQPRAPSPGTRDPSSVRTMPLAETMPEGTRTPRGREVRESGDDGAVDTHPALR